MFRLNVRAELIYIFVKGLNFYVVLFASRGTPPGFQPGLARRPSPARPGSSVRPGPSRFLESFCESLASGLRRCGESMQDDFKHDVMAPSGLMSDAPIATLQTLRMRLMPFGEAAEAAS